METQLIYIGQILDESADGQCLWWIPLYLAMVDSIKMAGTRIPTSKVSCK